MRILIALRSHNVEAAVEALAEIATEHEVIVAHEGEPEVSAMLELGLRNALPDRDVVTVVPQMVVSGDDPSPEPYAIAQLRSLRLLVDAGVLVICPNGGGVPIEVDQGGALRGVDAMVDRDLSASLLARRLDADMLVMLTDGDEPVDSQEEAARRFVEATERPVATGALTDAVKIVRGGAGARHAPRDA